MGDREVAHPVVGFVEFRDSVDEWAAEEIGLREPFSQRWAQPRESVERCAAGAVNLAKKPLAPGHALTIEHSLDETFLGPKDFIERRFGGEASSMIVSTPTELIP